MATLSRRRYVNWNGKTEEADNGYMENGCMENECMDNGVVGMQGMEANG
jgi:hypothetical protein